MLVRSQKEEASLLRVGSRDLSRNSVHLSRKLIWPNILTMSRHLGNYRKGAGGSWSQRLILLSKTVKLLLSFGTGSNGIMNCHRPLRFKNYVGSLSWSRFGQGDV